MFICENCIVKCEGPAIDLAVEIFACGVSMGMSRGRCELCETGPYLCYDVRSSGNWKVKDTIESKAVNTIKET